MWGVFYVLNIVNGGGFLGMEGFFLYVCKRLLVQVCRDCGVCLVLCRICGWSRRADEQRKIEINESQKPDY